VVNGINCQQIRARVSTVGATVVAGYVLVRGF
jgi:predicted signal transduction protein with EAL and GGDEF domain